MDTPARAAGAARRILGNPADYAGEPDLYRAAWAVLMASTGRSFAEAPLGPARHRIEPAGAASLSARIQARAAALGASGPRPLILKDAAR